MNCRLLPVLLALVLGLSCLTSGEVRAQAEHAQYYYYPDKEEQEYRREERKREKEYRREERRREREYQQWYDEEWRRHNQRYFGGTAVQPYPGESYESYIRRVRAQCNAQWNRCANYCNTIRDPYARAACVANCNNDLYECNSRR